MYYILHGDEEFSRAEAVANFKKQILGEGMGDLNISVLDGHKATLNELINACNTLPFLTDRRLVIVKDLLQRFTGQGHARRSQKAASSDENDDLQKLLDYLPHLPPSTRLIFVETRALAKNHAALQAAAQNDDAYVLEYGPVQGDKLQDWVRARARLKKTTITREAVKQLIAFLGNDLRLIDIELEKLAAFVDYDRPITAEDVQMMVSTSHEESIFVLVDSLGLRQGRQAMRSLQELLAKGANELYILTMIARQFRLILGAKDLADNGASEAQIRQNLGIPNFVVPKLLRQAQHFQMEELESIHRRALEMDRAIKTGRIEARLALELLVAETCQRSRKS